MRLSPWWPDWLRTRTTLAVMALAIALRLVGTVFNNEANDPHIHVSQIMAYEHRVPADTESWEAFQPKLYHGAVAAALMVLPPVPYNVQIRVAQLLSCIAGIVTLLLLRSLLERLPLRQPLRELSFALVALNPKMVAISMQATNDAFVTVFGTLALVAGWHYFRERSWRWFGWMCAGLLLVSISKGNGLVLPLAVVCTYAAALLQPEARRAALWRHLGVGLVAFALFVPYTGSYLTRYLDTGQIFYSSQPPSPPPAWNTPTLVKRPGVTSIVDSYFTFRLVDLLRHPQTTNEVETFPAHRTSLWSFAYASGHTQHYDQFPPTWESSTPLVLGLLRAIYLLALVPTAVLLYGMLAAACRSVASLLRLSREREPPGETLFSVAAWGMVAFLMLYTFQYRDFGTMKAIFCYPVIAALMWAYVRSQAALDTRLPLLGRAACGLAWLLCAAYVLDTAILLKDLVAAQLG